MRGVILHHNLLSKQDSWVINSTINRKDYLLHIISLKAQKSTQREVARLGETLRFSLEDIARVVLPGYLERHLGVKVEKLKRKHFNIEGSE